MGAISMGWGGVFNATVFYKNRQKTTRTNDAGQKLYGPDWAQDLNRTVQEQLYILAVKLDKNPDNAKTKETRQKLLEQTQDLQKLLTVVDGDGQPIPGAKIKFLLKQAKTEKRVIEIERSVEPEIELDLNSGTALPAPKRKIGPLDV